jgi:polyvinyl alcohol dehydrogenase (cytochrome)
MFRIDSHNGPFRRSLRTCGVAFAAVVIAAFALGSPALAGGGASWLTIGQNAANGRYQGNEHAISSQNASELALKWVATTTGDVSGTPVVAGGAVYFGDFGGTVWKLDANTGAVIWSHAVSDYTGLAGDYARSSPSLDGNVLIVGTNKNPDLLGINATDGTLLWKTLVNPDLHGTMTGSPVLVGNTVITGVSAAGAGGTTAGQPPDTTNATFRADIAAVNALTGQLLWHTYGLPSNNGPISDPSVLTNPGDSNNPGGFAGATIFSPPAVDVADGLVIATFGQPYTEPPAVAACNANLTSTPSPNGFNEACENGYSGVYFDSIVAFNLKTGTPVWSYRVLGDAAWHHACDADPVAWCSPESANPLPAVGQPWPPPPTAAGAAGSIATGGDIWDLGGSGANVFKIGNETVVGVGEKSGLYVVLDAKTGKFVWNTLVGPGGDQGGFEWGTAYDGSRIYVSLTNQHHTPYQLTEDGKLTSTTATGGSWAALDPVTGKIIWQTADPQTETLPAPTGTVGVWDLAPVTVAAGVVYAASVATSGNEMYALDAATGRILWQYAAGSTVNAAPAVANGSVYWGSGYSRAAEGSGNNKLYAFSIYGVVDTTPPTTTITLSPATPNGSHGSYSGPVAVAVTATDNPGGSGVNTTRCALDPATVPTSYADLPARHCSLRLVHGAGTHTIYAASADRDNNVETPISSRFKIS